MASSHVRFGALLGTIALSVIVGCSSSSNSSPRDGGTDAPMTTPDAKIDAIPFDGLIILAKDSYDTGGKIAVLSRPASLFPSNSAIASGKTYPGTFGDGEYRVADVPVGPYLFALGSTAYPDFPSLGFTTYLAASARTFDDGFQFTVRPGLKPMTASSQLSFDLTVTVPWQASLDGTGMGTSSPDDVLSCFSRNTGMAGFFGSGQGTKSPPNGVKSLGGWTVDASSFLYGSSSYASSAFDATEGDTLDVMHGVTTQVTDGSKPAGDPWQTYTAISVVESFHSAPFTLTNGGSATLTGSFQPTPGKPITIDYRGTQYNALLADLPTQAFTYANVTIDVLMEPGTPNPGNGGDATLLSIEAYGAPPACGLGCDLTTCPSGCDDAAGFDLAGDEKHALSYGDPFDYGQEMVNVYYGLGAQGPSFPSDSAQEAADAGSFQLPQFSGYINQTIPVSDIASAPLAPTLGFPRDVKLDGAPLPIATITTNVGMTPTLTFSPPALGTPTYYSVKVWDLDFAAGTHGATRTDSVLAYIQTTATTLQLPPGILSVGKHYYLQVGANFEEGYDPNAPNHYAERELNAVTFTGAFTPKAEEAFPCNVAACPPPAAGPCSSLGMAICSMNACGVSYAPALAPSQRYGSCTENMCDATGVMTTVAQPANSFEGSSPCAMYSCQSGTSTAQYFPVGTACTVGSVSGFCETSPKSGALVCAECAPGSPQACAANPGTLCVSGTCVATHCTNATKDVDETDVDCGGSACLPCGAAQSCSGAADCLSGVCVASSCQASTCSDAVQNGTESDIDCGGSCPPCADNLMCDQPSDCGSGVCLPANEATPVDLCAVPSCFDGVMNEGETGVDCGGPCVVCPG